MMNAMIAMCVKDLRLLVRDRMGFFFAIFFPLLMAIFFGTVFSSGGDSGDGEVKKMNVLVVDGDKTSASAKFLKQLSEAEEFRVTEAASVEAAAELIRQGKGYVAAVHITPGYGEASERMFWGDPPLLEVYTDPSRKAEIGMFQGLLTKYAFMRMQEMFAEPQKFVPSTREALAQLREADDVDPQARAALEMFLPNLETFLETLPAESEEDGEDAVGIGGMASWEPVKITAKAVQAEGVNGPPNGFAVTFPQGIMWGVLGCSLAMALSLVTERTRGTMVRLRMAPLASWQVLGGKAMTCFLLIVAMAAILLVIGAMPMFDVRPTSLPILALGVACTAACFTGLMMLVAAIGRTEAAAAGLGWAVMLIFSMIGGGMIPLFLMRDWLQTLSSISPVKWGILAIEGGIWRGFSLAEMMTPCAVLLGIGAVGFVAGVGVMRREA
jgi:ABC-2 type transport system permease protein